METLYCIPVRAVAAAVPSGVICAVPAAVAAAAVPALVAIPAAVPASVPSAVVSAVAAEFAGPAAIGLGGWGPVGPGEKTKITYVSENPTVQKAPNGKKNGKEERNGNGKV